MPIATNLGGKKAREILHQNEMRFQQQQIHVNFFFFPDNLQGKTDPFHPKTFTENCGFLDSNSLILFTAMGNLHPSQFNSSACSRSCGVILSG